MVFKGKPSQKRQKRVAKGPLRGPPIPEKNKTRGAKKKLSGTGSHPGKSKNHDERPHKNDDARRAPRAAKRRSSRKFLRRSSASTALSSCSRCVAAKEAASRPASLKKNCPHSQPCQLGDWTGESHPYKLYIEIRWMDEILFAPL